MREMLANLRPLVIASVVESEFEDPARRDEIARNLRGFVAHAQQVSRHTAGWEGAAGSLGRSLAADTREIQRAFDEGRTERAAFLLRQVTENCVACHSRLPSRDSPQAEDFVADGALAGLDPEDRATLQIATRRFDPALATLEGMLADPGQSPVVLLGPLTDYLTVAIRVKGDPRRPVPVLQRFARRPDLWPQLHSDVDTWIATLQATDAAALGRGDLASARAWIRRGSELDSASGSHAGLAHLVLGSAVLHRLVHEQRRDPGAHARELGEAYYLLGVSEARIGRNYWVTQAPFFLESSIRLAPGEPFARDAYALLESETERAYEGSSVESLPAEDRARLAELRQLIAAAQGSPPPPPQK
jgi:hypothetical protein